jgi:hypothetical protein
MEELHTKQNEALNVLIEAVRFAQAKGAFSIEQAAFIASAIKTFQTEEVQEKAPENSENK